MPFCSKYKMICHLTHAVWVTLVLGAWWLSNVIVAAWPPVTVGEMATRVAFKSVVEL